MIISKDIEIDMGHAVTDHCSKCKHLHGHRYLIRALVEDKVIAEKGSSAYGMVIDFSDLKKAMMDVIDAKFDHAFALWKGDPRIGLLQEAHDLWHNDYDRFHSLHFVPTAENLACHWFQLLHKELRNKYNIKLVELHVYETPTSMVRCNQEDVDDFIRRLYEDDDEENE